MGLAIFFCVLIIVFIALLLDEDLKQERFYIFGIILALIFLVTVLTIPSA